MAMAFYATHVAGCIGNALPQKPIHKRIDRYITTATKNTHTVRNYIRNYEFCVRSSPISYRQYIIQWMCYALTHNMWQTHTHTHTFPLSRGCHSPSERVAGCKKLDRIKVHVIVIKIQWFINVGSTATRCRCLNIACSADVHCKGDCSRW